VLMKINGSDEVYGLDEQALHNNIIDFGFKQCTYNALTRELQIGTDANWYTGNNLYVRNPKLAQDLLPSAKRNPVIGMLL
jgi:hypothetical protein